MGREKQEINVISSSILFSYKFRVLFGHIIIKEFNRITLIGRLIGTSLIFIPHYVLLSYRICLHKLLLLPIMTYYMKLYVFVKLYIFSYDTTLLFLGTFSPLSLLKSERSSI